MAEMHRSWKESRRLLEEWEQRVDKILADGYVVGLDNYGVTGVGEPNLSDPLGPAK